MLLKSRFPLLCALWRKVLIDNGDGFKHSFLSSDTDYALFFCVCAVPRFPLHTSPSSDTDYAFFFCVCAVPGFTLHTSPCMNPYIYCLASESTRLRHRVMDLRRPFMQRNIRIRAKALKTVRNGAFILSIIALNGRQIGCVEELPVGFAVHLNVLWCKFSSTLGFCWKLCEQH